MFLKTRRLFYTASQRTARPLIERNRTLALCVYP